MTDSFGLVYMVFGEKARQACIASVESFRKFCPTEPVVIVGDNYGKDIPGTRLIPWAGQSPYKPGNPTQFQFLAGRVKPFLYDITPFEKTLYLDADTEFQSSPLKGFDLLNRYDFMLAKHSSHNVGMLSANPGKERITTIIEIGGSGDVPYPNSGVVFWKKCPDTERLFKAWYDEWLRFQAWDEQCALMRAIYKNPVRMLLLPEAWNGENKREGGIIFHDFHGKHVARTDLELAGVFTQIHQEHSWPSKESVSGPGSEIGRTVNTRTMLPVILKSLGIKTMLDAGCGDWNWMSQVNLEGIEYQGCDIVPNLIEANKVKYPGYRFFLSDITCDELPKAELVLCRSVLFHFTYENIKQTIANLKDTGAEWLLTSSFPYSGRENKDIKDGGFRYLTMEKPPFSWPYPKLYIPEPVEMDGWLGLWRLPEIKA